MQENYGKARKSGPAAARRKEFRRDLPCLGRNMTAAEVAFTDSEASVAGATDEREMAFDQSVNLVCAA